MAGRCGERVGARDEGRSEREELKGRKGGLERGRRRWQELLVPELFKTEDTQDQEEERRREFSSWAGDAGCSAPEAERGNSAGTERMCLGSARIKVFPWPSSRNIRDRRTNCGDHHQRPGECHRRSYAVVCSLDSVELFDDSFSSYLPSEMPVIESSQHTPPTWTTTASDKRSSTSSLPLERAFAP
jgi:hypothetical protein